MFNNDKYIKIKFTGSVDYAILCKIDLEHYEGKLF